MRSHAAALLALLSSSALANSYWATECSYVQYSVGAYVTCNLKKRTCSHQPATCNPQNGEVCSMGLCTFGGVSADSVETCHRSSELDNMKVGGDCYAGPTSDFPCDESHPCPSGGACIEKAPNGEGTECVASGCYSKPIFTQTPVLVKRCEANGNPDTFIPGANSDRASNVCGIGGRSRFGDPVTLSNQGSEVSVVDVEVPSSVLPIRFVRTLDSSWTRWTGGSTGTALSPGLWSLGRSQDGYIALPFGGKPDRDWTMQWHHNYFSFVWLESAERWQVVLPGGERANFTPCTPPSGQQTCTAALFDSSREARAQLVYSTNGTFAYSSPGGLTFLYASPLSTAQFGGGTTTRVFLSAIRDRANSRDVLTVTYGLPPTSECPNPPGVDQTTGVPLIRELTTADGAKLKLHYVSKGPYARNTIPGLDQCVLRSLWVGAAASPSVEYLYSSNDTIAGLVSVVKNYLKPEQGAGYSTSTFEYPSGSSGVLRVFAGTSSGSNREAIRHDLAIGHDLWAATASYVSAGGELLAQPEYRFSPNVGNAGNQTVVSCPVSTSCLAGTALETIMELPNRTSGTGANALVTDELRATQILNPWVSGPRTTSTSTLKNSGLNISAPVPEASYQFSDVNGTPYNSFVIGYRSDVASTAQAGQGIAIEVTRVTSGRLGSPTGDIEAVDYDYDYVGSPPQQVTTLEERPSVVPTQSGKKARTHYRYETNGRLSAVIREGYTRTAGGNPQSSTWQDTPRAIGTFFRTSHSSGGSADWLGRTLEVQGPCRVVDENSTGCLDATFPVTRVFYQSAAPHRLQAVTRYPNGVANPGLTTSFGNYSELGGAQLVTDENNVQRAYTFEEDRPTSMTIGGKTWSWFYDRGHLTKIARPEGDSDVICYRRLASAAIALQSGCDSSENPSDQPTAIFRYGTGSAGGAWYEATLLMYGSDGMLREEAVYQPGNSTPVRRTTRERNPLGFTTFEKTGPTPAGGAERTTRQFAPDGLVVAQGTPYFAAPDFCGTPGTARSDLCAKFDYWNTGRLKQLTVNPLVGATDISVCLDYDAHGNVIGVKPGCTTTGMHGYVFDDFGNVIEAKLANVDPSVPTRFEYDAMGNLVRKGMLNSSGTTTVLEWSYDLLSRPTRSVENGTTVLRWYWDNQGTPTPAPGCTALVSTSNQNGRLTLASDAVWHTWYSYDAEGRVVREARIARSLDLGGSCISQGLDTNQVLERTFSSNGNVATLTYPSQRQVAITYDASKRASAIGMTTWNGSWSASPLTMVQNIAWFPGGVLKSYDLVTYEALGGAASTVNVSYRYGANGASPTAAIPGSTCSWGAEDPNGSGDSSGRLRAIYVTRSGTDVLRVFYRWKGEQVTESSRCYLNAEAPLWERFEDASSPDFQYDVAGRLGGANVPNYDYSGGPGYKRVYRYDTRNNRTKTEQYAATGYSFIYGSGQSWAPDRLTRMANHDGVTADPVLAMARDSSGAATVAVRSGRNRDYDYDGAGRVTAIRGATTRAAPTTPPVLLTFNFDNMGQPPTGTETVMRVATTQAGSFNYFYDAQNRRVRKQYPNGDVEGFFWSDGRELLMETSPTSIGGGKRTMDEYLWLGGRPVVTIRSRYTDGPSWTRFPGVDDWYSDCARRDEAGTCRPHAIISDVIGKPIGSIDSSRKVAGVLEYDPYGHTNRVEHWGEVTPSQNSGCWWVTAWMKQGMGPLEHEARAMVPRVDLNDYIPGVQGGCLGQYKSFPWEWPYSAPAGNDFCGARTDYRFPWTTLASGQGLHVLYCSYENNVSPQPFGVTVRGYEYRKRETGTSHHYIPPFRFPGQYYDAETDLYENWNRYYDPSTGRYLSPEPLLQSPSWVASQLRSGQQVPSYSYAGNNPVGNVDPNGLETLILYGNPLFEQTPYFSRASYEAALVSHFFPFSGETDPSRVVAVSAESGFPARSLSNSTAGRPWEHVIYFGHGAPGSLNPSDISVSPETFAGWFGGRSPGRVSLSGCFAGAPDAPFVTRARQLLPFSSFAGVNGSLGVSVRPTWQGQFGGFLSLTPPFPNVVYPSWANANGWYR